MKIKKILLCLSVILLSIIVSPAIYAAENTVNPFYLGTYVDEANSEAYITAAEDGVYLTAYFYDTCYIRTYCTTYTLDDNHFSASSSSARKCTEKGVFLSDYVYNFATQGSLPYGTTTPKIHAHGHIYAKQY